MRKTAIFVSAVLALSMVATVSSAKPASKAKPVVPSRLLPLSEAEMFSGDESGCQLAFSQGNDNFIFIIDHRFTIKTSAGVQNCTMTQDQYERFGTDSTAMICGGRQLVVRPTGPGKSYPEADSAEGPAALTMTESGKSRTVKGKWSSAC